MDERDKDSELGDAVALRSSVSVGKLGGSGAESDEVKLQPPPDVDWDDWVKAAGCAQERAERARRVAELKLAQKTCAKDAQIKVFTGPKAHTSRSKSHQKKSSSQSTSSKPADLPTEM
jgi:hypothetical protein